MIDRQKARALLEEKLPNKNLVRHCIAVEAAMRALAKHFDEDVEVWGIAGLLHDMDWEATREDASQHTRKTLEWIAEAGGADERIIDAILSHNYKNNGEHEPRNNMEWSLYCCDELTGFIVAVALVRPEKKLAPVELKSVLKRFPQKAFAAGVHREQIQLCEEKLGIKLEDFVALVLNAMKESSTEIGM
jgi:uncharacterized protein